MATILKWWKLKMLGKYRHFSGIASESEGHHSELDGSQRSSSFCCRGHRCPSSTDETQLYQSSEVDEDEVCSLIDLLGPPLGDEDVGEDGEERVEERTDPALIPLSRTDVARTPPKDEFNFTLYDFNGHGKVTKDDIAGLVKAIYEVVGSSVHVPPSGSKTINVKLTVTPEQGRLNNGTPAPGADGAKRDLSITIQNEPATPNRTKVSSRRCQDDINLRAGGEVGVESRRPRFNSMRCQQGPTVWRALSPERAPAADRSPLRSRLLGGAGEVGADQSPQRTRPKCAVEPMQRRHLAEMIQNNTEKNNLKVNNLKRHNSEREYVRYRLNPTVTPLRPLPREELNKSAPPAAGRCRDGNGEFHYCTVGEINCPNLLRAEEDPACQGACVRERWSKRHAACRARRCQRAPAPAPALRSYVEDDYELLARCAEFAVRDAQQQHQAALASPRLRPGGRHHRAAPGHGHGGSPHHQQRHRNREKDHYRAMQQVLNWLEREHPTPTSAGPNPAPPAADPQQPPDCDCDPPPPPEQQPPPPPPAGGGSKPTSQQQRVEHHHVHEHVHHHYHHFPKDAVIL